MSKVARKSSIRVRPGMLKAKHCLGSRRPVNGLLEFRKSSAPWVWYKCPGCGLHFDALPCGEIPNHPKKLELEREDG